MRAPPAALPCPEQHERRHGGEGARGPASYTARSNAYLLLLTETCSPFQDEHTRAAGTV